MPLPGHKAGEIFEIWAETAVRLLEIEILERDGLDLDTVRELRENADAFLRFGKPLASLPREVQALDGTH